MKNYLRIARLVVAFGQLGFTLITPPVVMSLVGWWLQSRFGLGTWVMLVCLAIGLLTAAASAWQFYLRVMEPERKKEKRTQRDKRVVFYTHE